MLTPDQVAAIIGLLMAFGVGQPTLGIVQGELTVQPQQAPTQSIPVLPLGNIPQAPDCVSTPVIDTAFIPQGPSENLGSLSVPYGGSIDFKVLVSTNCLGNWNVWLDTGSTSSYDNIYGSPSYNAYNVFDTSPLPVFIDRSINYNPLTTGNHVITFFAGNGISTSSLSQQVVVQ